MVVLALSDSSDTVDSVYRHHHRWLHNWLWRKLGCSAGAADLAQETFLRILAAGMPPSLREPRAYLSTIANGLLASHWRHLAVERAYLDALAALPVPLQQSPEERALVLEALGQVDAVLAKLAPKARHAFLASQLHGMTYAAIAAELQVSERMVKKYMAQAMLQCMLALDMLAVDMQAP